jgi:hypothetical protein
MSEYISVMLEGRRKKPRRKPSLMYKKRWNKLQRGQISRVNIYNWNARCNTPPKQYIHRVYRNLYKVIEVDKTGFTVICLQERERWPSQTA